jgi:exopolysaccharide biosynthesis WecB/TagA/CpsF family protein
MTLTSRSLPEWRSIFDVPVAALYQAEAAELVRSVLDAKGFLRVNFLNANNANIATGNAALADALSRSVVLSDGAGVNLASRVLYGKAFPANLNGTDFVPHLLKSLPAGTHVGLVGAAPDVIRLAADALATLAPQVRLTAIHHGFFEPKDDAGIAALIAGARPDVLLVAMGTPRQEIFCDNHLTEAHARVIITVGALFDFLSLRVPRAPRLLRKLGAEWVFRLALEPRRLFRRYVIGNPVFVSRLLRQRATGRGVASTRKPGGHAGDGGMS